MALFFCENVKKMYLANRQFNQANNPTGKST